MKRMMRRFCAIMLVISISLSGIFTAFAEDSTVTEAGAAVEETESTAVMDEPGSTAAVEEESVPETVMEEEEVSGLALRDEYLGMLNEIQNAEPGSGSVSAENDALLSDLMESSVSEGNAAFFNQYLTVLKEAGIYTEEELEALLESGAEEEPEDVEFLIEEFTEMQAHLLSEVYYESNTSLDDECLAENCGEECDSHEEKEDCEADCLTEEAGDGQQTDASAGLTALQNQEGLLSETLLGSSVCSGAFSKNAKNLYNYIQSNGSSSSDGKYISKSDVKSSTVYAVTIKATSTNTLHFSMIAAPSGTSTYPGNMVTFDYNISSHTIGSVKTTYLYNASYGVWGYPNVNMSTATGTESTYTYSSITYSSTSARTKLYSSISTIKTMWTLCVNIALLMDSLLLSDKLSIGMADIGFVSLDVAKNSGHSFTKYVSNYDGTKTAKCDYCSVTNTIADSGKSFQVIGGVSYYCINGTPQTSVSGFVEVDGGNFFVANGVLQLASGLIQDLANPADWYFCANGEAQKVTSLVQYDGAWFYVNDGKLNTGLSGYVDYNGGKFYVAAGEIKRGVNGLAQDPANPTVWYYLSNGEVQNQYTGLCQYNGSWFYAEAGRFATEFSGAVRYNGTLFYVSLGEVSFNANGILQGASSGAWYLVSGGVVQESFTGLQYSEGQNYYIKNGIWMNTYTGEAEIGGTKYYIENGIVGDRSKYYFTKDLGYGVTIDQKKTVATDHDCTVTVESMAIVQRYSDGDYKVSYRISGTGSYTYQGHPFITYQVKAYDASGNLLDEKSEIIESYDKVDTSWTIFPSNTKTITVEGWF